MTSHQKIPVPQPKVRRRKINPWAVPIRAVETIKKSWVVVVPLALIAGMVWWVLFLVGSIQSGAWEQVEVTTTEYADDSLAGWVFITGFLLVLPSLIGLCYYLYWLWKTVEKKAEEWDSD